jgi:protoporphyrinogen oxidase
MNNQDKKQALIIGAGPAGLTAAYELLEKTDIKPIIFEATADIGGISKTVNYKGNRIDIGGHRFFSKSDRVMQWWQNIISLEEVANTEEEKFMMVRSRLSRIFYLRKFFDYPISLNFTTLRNLGLVRILKIGFSYLRVRLFPIKPEKSLEDFFINRFGRELYLTFFKDYTEKLWGISCDKIQADWGAQRVKGLSISRAIWHGIKSIFKKDNSIDQKNTETSLIDKFLYPKFGPGQLWEEVARQIKEKGGEIYLNHEVIELNGLENNIKNIKVLDKKSGEEKKFTGDYIFSSMPVKNLIRNLQLSIPVPQEVKTVSDGLVYRDFITIGLLLDELKVKNQTKIKTHNNLIPDNWIYIQERDVKIGRLQIFNNWSPYMVADSDKVWLGLEYFCNEGDDFWEKVMKILFNLRLAN